MSSAPRRITPFLWYDTQAEDAANYYVTVFPNSRIIDLTRYGEAGPGPKGSVMVVRFELDGQELMALNGGPNFTFNEAVSFSVDCASQAEVDYYWERLGADGEEGPCGWVKDRYGLWWQVNPRVLGEMMADPDPLKAKRATEAMLQMKKIVISELEAAYNEV